MERAEYLGPPLLEVAVPLEAPFYHNLDSPLRLRPCQRRLKGGARVEERSADGNETRCALGCQSTLAKFSMEPYFVKHMARIKRFLRAEY